MGLYQKDVAKIIGVSTDTITNWEKGRTKPCKKNFEQIERFLEIFVNHHDVIDYKQAKRVKGTL